MKHINVGAQVNNKGDAVRSVNGAIPWLDLSGTGNRRPWVAPDPQPVAGDDLTRLAAAWFGCQARQVRPVAGPPRLERLAARWPAGRAALLTGCGQSLHAAGWQVRQVDTLAALAGADLAVIANPRDPDGQEWPAAALADLALRVGRLIVDETLADARPDLSLAPTLPPNALILRSPASLWGITGLHFVLSNQDLPADLPPPDARVQRLCALAFADRRWTDDTVLYLTEAVLRLDRLAVGAGWRPAGGTHLFRRYRVADAAGAQDRLAHARIRPHRIGADHLRLAIPVCRAEWDRLAAALAGIAPAPAPDSR